MTLTLPLVACKVKALAFTGAFVPLVMEPFVLARITTAALPVAPAIPATEPEVVIFPLPVPVPVAFRKKVPELMIVEEVTVTVEVVL